MTAVEQSRSMLFSSLRLRDITVRNRLCISAMCTYRAKRGGEASDWHLVHLGQYALGGAGIVFVEVTAVEPHGRTTHGDLGLWSDAQIGPLSRIAAFLREHGAIPAIQLGHAGRKGSAQRPWHGMSALGPDDVARGEAAWETVSSTGQPMAAGWHTRHSLTMYDRTDEYGGDLAARMRLPLEVVGSVRDEWPASLPMFARISAVDGQLEGWTLDDSVSFARELKASGVDVVDCSSGGVVGSATARGMPRGYGFQVPFAERIRHEAGVATMAVGLIVGAAQAEEIVATGKADLVAIGRQALFSPYWPHHAARELGVDGRAYDGWPKEYGWWLDRREETLRRIDAETTCRPSFCT